LTHNHLVETSIFEYNFQCSGVLLNGTVRPEMAQFSCSRQGKWAARCWTIPRVGEMKLRRVSPEIFGTGRDEVATLRVSLAQTRSGNIQAGNSRMLRPMGKASPPLVGKCRASTRPPSRVLPRFKKFAFMRADGL